jgi:hypothetical protein
MLRTPGSRTRASETLIRNMASLIDTLCTFDIDKRAEIRTTTRLFLKRLDAHTYYSGSAACEAGPEAARTPDPARVRRQEL